MLIMDDGELCSLAKLMPGLFRVGSSVGLKTEYGAMSGRPIAGGGAVWSVTDLPDAYVVESGEVWWGGAADHASRSAQIVQPVRVSTT